MKQLKNLIRVTVLGDENDGDYTSRVNQFTINTFKEAVPYLDLIVKCGRWNDTSFEEFEEILGRDTLIKFSGAEPNEEGEYDEEEVHEYMHEAAHEYVPYSVSDCGEIHTTYIDGILFIDKDGNAFECKYEELKTHLGV